MMYTEVMPDRDNHKQKLNADGHKFRQTYKVLVCFNIVECISRLSFNPNDLP